MTEIIPQTTAHTYDNECDEECNVCGAAREVSHSFGTGWTYSYKGHWHTCTVCGEAGEVKAHYPGPAATEEKNQICLTCGYVMTKKLEHIHKYPSDWSSDSEGHWYVCTGCQEKDGFAVHTYLDDCDPDCNDCGYVREPLHEYGVWQSDENGHWQVCARCGEQTEAEPHSPSRNGSEDTQCIVCLYPMTTEHIHEFRTEWNRNETAHWQECECGDKAEEGEHIWDEGKEEEDLIVFTCEVCQAEKQEEAPEKGVPWGIMLAGAGILICAAGIIACILLGKQKGSFSR